MTRVVAFEAKAAAGESIACQNAFTSRFARYDPMQACAPAPKGKNRPLVFLSSARSGEKRFEVRSERGRTTTTGPDRARPFETSV